MKTIAYYISDYGYGHATRSIAVIRELLQKPNRYRLLICSSTPILSFVRSSLMNQNTNIGYRSCSSDLGYVLQSASIEPDMASFRIKYEAYVQAIPTDVQREKEFLREKAVDLVISDISPIPILAANEAGVTSVGLSNFTWYTAYKAMIDHKSLQVMYEAYSGMDYYISLEGANEPAWGIKGMFQAGFFCRKVDEREVLAIQRAINPDRHKKIVYFGIGMSIHAEGLSSLKLWDDEAFTFIVSSNMKVSHSNVTAIPASYTESQNYVAAADLVISKPSWSTIAEAVVLQKPLMLLRRSGLEEDENTIRAIETSHPCHMVKWEQLEIDGLTEVRAQEYDVTCLSDRNEANRIVAYIEQIIRSG